MYLKIYISFFISTSGYNMMENVKIWIGLINKKVDDDNAASFLLGQADLLMFVFT